MDNKQKNNRRSVFGNILIILGLLLIAASIGLTVYNLWDAERAAQESNAIADILIKETAPMAGAVAIAAIVSLNILLIPA